MKTLGPLVRVKTATPLSGYKMQLMFEDGTEKVIDLEPFLHGSMFAPIKNDETFFRQVKIEGGTVAWPNGADIDPDVLYYDLKPAWMEELETA